MHHGAAQEQITNDAKYDCFDRGISAIRTLNPKIAMMFRNVARHFQVRPKQRVVLTMSRWAARNVFSASEHHLQRPLIVSLTSYAARFPTLHLTLKCLLTQSIKPDRVVLWLSQNDFEKIPRSVSDLRAFGLDIRQCPALRSYSKIIPAIVAFPDAIIVTADDDIYYERHWLEALVTTWDGSDREIVCHRAHGVVMNEQGGIAPYQSWHHSIDMNGDARFIFPTGSGGVLYPPGSLAPEVIDSSRFLALAPYADDLWLYWMGRRAGSRYRIASRSWRLVTWPKSQTTSLYSHNRMPDGNDLQIANLVKTYGVPTYWR